jgi:hypothetical protein
MAKQDRDDSLEVHCGRCGKLLTVRLEDIKEKRTIDCVACENMLPAENALGTDRSATGSESCRRRIRRPIRRA